MSLRLSQAASCRRNSWATRAFKSWPAASLEPPGTSGPHPQPTGRKRFAAEPEEQDLSKKRARLDQEAARLAESSRLLGLEIAAAKAKRRVELQQQAAAAVEAMRKFDEDD